MVFEIKYIRNDDNSDTRAWHSGVSNNSFYNYILRDGSINDKQRSEGLAPVFNFDGLMTYKELKARKKLSMKTNSHIWSGFISFDLDEAEGFETQEKAIFYMNDVFKKFLKNAGFDIDEIDFLASLHIDTDYKHIHFQFFEKRPYKFETTSKDKGLKAVDRLSYTVKPRIKKESLERIHEYNALHFANYKHLYFNDKDKAIEAFEEYMLNYSFKRKDTTFIPNIEKLRSNLKKKKKTKLNSLIEGNNLEELELLKVLGRQFIASRASLAKNYKKLFKNISDEDLNLLDYKISEQMLAMINILNLPLVKTNRYSGNYSKKIDAKMYRDFRTKIVRNTKDELEVMLLNFIMSDNVRKEDKEYIENFKTSSNPLLIRIRENIK